MSGVEPSLETLQGEAKDFIGLQPHTDQWTRETAGLTPALMSQAPGQYVWVKDQLLEKREIQSFVWPSVSVTCVHVPLSC